MNSLLKKIIELTNSVDIAEQVSKCSKPIYHYTSPSGFAGIMKSSELRFTDHSFLNDQSESVYTLKLCEAKIQELIPDDEEFCKAFLKKCRDYSLQPPDERFHIYQCSFSNNKDSLALWNYYTKGDTIRGYNLIFDPTKLETGLKPKQRQGKKYSPQVFMGCVEYKEDRQLTAIRAIIEKYLPMAKEINDIYGKRMLAGYALDKILLLGAFFKKGDFAVEDEVRMVLNLCVNEDGKYALIENEQKFSEKNGYFIPYLDIQFEPKALTGITLAPTLDSALTRNSILQITRKHFAHLQTENIDASDIPVRY